MMEDFKWWGIIIIVFVCILLLAFIASKGNSVVKKNNGIYVFGYYILYADAKNVKGRQLKSRVLHSEEYNISGRCDYILKSRIGNKYIPVELKSGAIGEEDYPRMGDLYQLVSYFVLIEENFGTRPKKGLLVYKDYKFVVKNTRYFRKNLKNILLDMRDMLETGEGIAEPSFVKCRYCLCNNTVCEFC